jgi:GrpB-like predicted nucleotidyltransferase (UPF0157 family)
VTAAARSPVELVPARAEWPRQFEQLAVELQAVFPAGAVRLAHIGSTSVPGLIAKPVLDVLAGAAALATFEAAVPALAALGFVYRPAYEAQLPDRRYFVRDAGTLPRVHLHGCVEGGPFWRRHLAFRDALRAQPAVAAEYAALKQGLVQRFAHDREAYTDGKTAFIEAVVARWSA